MKQFDASQFETKELVAIWNSIAEKKIKKFVNRKTAQMRIEKVIESGGVDFVNFLCRNLDNKGTIEKLEAFLSPNEKQSRNDGKYRRKTPIFNSDQERDHYIQTQYKTKTERFPGKKSQFFNCVLQLKNPNMQSPFREDTIVDNSFKLIAYAQGILYQDFRARGGRNTDLKAMVDRGFVTAVKQNLSED